MGAPQAIPLRIAAEDPWAAIEAEDDAILDSYLSGEYDRKRLEASQRLVSLCDEAWKAGEPQRRLAEERAANRADEALLGLIRGLLSEDELKLIDSGLRTFHRSGL